MRGCWLPGPSRSGRLALAGCCAEAWAAASSLRHHARVVGCEAMARYHVRVGPLRSDAQARTALVKVRAEIAALRLELGITDDNAAGGEPQPRLNPSASEFTPTASAVRQAGGRPTVVVPESPGGGSGGDDGELSRPKSAPRSWREIGHSSPEKSFFQPRAQWLTQGDSPAGAAAVQSAMMAASPQGTGESTVWTNSGATRDAWSRGEGEWEDETEWGQERDLWNGVPYVPLPDGSE
jgi:hypothetical protein